MALEAVSETTKCLFILVVSLLLYYFIRRWLRNLAYPPGPVGLPLIGYLLFLGKNPHHTLKELSKKYGDVFSMYFGTTLHTFVCDYGAAKELLNHPLLMGRPQQAFEFLVGHGGFAGANGEKWQEQRRFVISTMRNLGLGKGPWEKMIQDDAAEFVEEVREWRGRAMDLQDPLSISQASNNVALLIGRRFDKNSQNPDIQVIRRTMDKLLQYFSAVSVNTTIPWMSKYLAAFRIAGYHRFFAQLREFEDMFRREVNNRMQSRDAPYEDDFIGMYLKEMDKRRKDTKTHYFTVDCLIGNMVLLFIAGNDSTIVSVSWLLLLMATYPDVQGRVHAEIDEVIGRDGQVYHDDRMRLPYTMATIMEMQRFIAVSPIFPPRIVEETFEFRGHTIPAGSNVIVNGWAIMHDERYQKDPFRFHPARFLHSEGRKVAKQSGYAPFSFGKNCKFITGKWYNQLGSELTIFQQNETTIVGEYRTGVERYNGSSGATPAPLKGVAKLSGPRPVLGFNVVFMDGLSSTAWIGECVVCEGDEALMTTWLLRKFVASPKDRWQSTMIGQDTFTRYEKVTPAQGPRVSRRQILPEPYKSNTVEGKFKETERTIEGKWYSSTGAELNLSGTDEHLKGNYSGEKSAVHGPGIRTYTQGTLGFSILKAETNTIKIWVGQPLERNGEQVLDTSFLQHSSSKSSEDSPKTVEFGTELFSRYRNAGGLHDKPEATFFEKMKNFFKSWFA